MNITIAAKLMELYAACPNCGCEIVGNGKGALECDTEAGFFRRSCGCGWCVEVTEGIVKEALAEDPPELPAMIVIVCVALVADWLIGMMMRNLPGIALPFTYTVLIGPLVIVWYVIGELGSLAEHAVHMGAPAPEWLPKILAAGKSAVDAAGDKIVGDEHHEEV